MMVLVAPSFLHELYIFTFSQLNTHLDPSMVQFQCIYYHLMMVSFLQKLPKTKAVMQTVDHILLTVQHQQQHEFKLFTWPTETLLQHYGKCCR